MTHKSSCSCSAFSSEHGLMCVTTSKLNKFWNWNAEETRKNHRAMRSSGKNNVMMGFLSALRPFTICIWRMEWIVLFPTTIVWVSEWQERNERDSQFSHFVIWSRFRFHFLLSVVALACYGSGIHERRIEIFHGVCVRVYVVNSGVWL